eukprot:symbB.v1.2.019960.t1/scaffold1656.1/size107472/7
MELLQEERRRSFAELRLQRRLHRGTRSGNSAGMVLQRHWGRFTESAGKECPRRKVDGKGHLEQRRAKRS